MVLEGAAFRQLFASALAERAGRPAPGGVAEYEQIVAERGAGAASASERTRELAPGLVVGSQLAPLELARSRSAAARRRT